MRPPTHNATVP